LEEEGKTKRLLTNWRIVGTLQWEANDYKKDPPLKCSLNHFPKEKEGTGKAGTLGSYGLRGQILTPLNKNLDLIEKDWGGERIECIQN